MAFPLSLSYTLQPQLEQLLIHRNMSLELISITSNPIPASAVNLLARCTALRDLTFNAVLTEAAAHSLLNVFGAMHLTRLHFAECIPDSQLFLIEAARQWLLAPTSRLVWVGIFSPLRDEPSAVEWKAIVALFKAVGVRSEQGSPLQRLSFDYSDWELEALTNLVEETGVGDVVEFSSSEP